MGCNSPSSAMLAASPAMSPMSLRWRLPTRIASMGIVAWSWVPGVGGSFAVSRLASRETGRPAYRFIGCGPSRFSGGTYARSRDCCQIAFADF